VNEVYDINTGILLRFGGLSRVFRRHVLEIVKTSLTETGPNVNGEGPNAK